MIGDSELNKSTTPNTKQRKKRKSSLDGWKFVTVESEEMTMEEVDSLAWSVARFIYEQIQKRKLEGKPLFYEPKENTSSQSSSPTL